MRTTLLSLKSFLLPYKITLNFFYSMSHCPKQIAASQFSFCLRCDFVVVAAAARFDSRN